MIESRRSVSLIASVLITSLLSFVFIISSASCRNSNDLRIELQLLAKLLNTKPAREALVNVASKSPEVRNLLQVAYKRGLIKIQPNSERPDRLSELLGDLQPVKDDAEVSDERVLNGVLIALKQNPEPLEAGIRELRISDAITPEEEKRLGVKVVRDGRNLAQPEELLDFLFSNKEWFANGLLLLFALTIFRIGNYLNEWRTSIYSETGLIPSWTTVFTSIADIRHRHRFFLAFIVCALVMLFVAGFLRFTPPTTALEWPDPVRTIPGTKKLLIFIHGWNGSADTTWGAFPGLVKSDGRFKDIDIWVLNYPTYMTRRNAHISDLAKWIDDGLTTRITRYSKVAIIAHSMGGLIGRRMSVLDKLGDRKRFDLLVEIATPHLGGNHAGIASALNISPGLTTEMEPGSSFLGDLQMDWQQMKKRPQDFCYWSFRDVIVTKESAFSDCEDRVTHPDWGHGEVVKPQSVKDVRYQLPMDHVYQYMKDEV